MPTIERASVRYRAHHRRHRTTEFVFAGPDRIPLFRRYVGRGRRVLDLGCRYGALTQEYLDGNEVVGVDVDRDALEEAAELGIEPVWADAEEPLPFAPESFDVVVAGELLEHLSEPEATVREIRRVLRPGGRLVGSVPNFFRLKSRVRFLFGRRPQFLEDRTHCQFYAPEDVRRLLWGFERVELHYVAGKLVPLNPRLFGNDIVFTGLKPR